MGCSWIKIYVRFEKSLSSSQILSESNRVEFEYIEANEVLELAKES